MDLHLHGKTVLVTGASQGIGFATASLFAEEGCKLFLVARKEEQLRKAAASISKRFGGHPEILVADLSQPTSIASIRSQVNEIDILINNAGSIPPGNLYEVDDNLWRQAWDLKVFGYINLVREFYPELKERQGVVVNIIGSSGERAEPHYLAGSAGNAALMAFTRGLGSMSPKDGVRVVGVNPGPVGTERIERLLKAGARRMFQDESRWQERFKVMPFGRPATPEEIANAVVFLASPRSSYTSGMILTIDDPARSSL